MNQGPDRRESKPFEPPPWERDQFEELRRKQEDERIAAEALKAHQEQVAASAPQPVPPEVTADPQDEKAVAAPVEKEPEESAKESARQAGPGPKAPQTELPAGFEAMLAQLAVEEPKTDSSFWKIGVAASAVLALIGLVVAVWGVVALTKTSGPAGTMGGAIMEIFGIGFVIFGGWMAMRSLKQRGVL